MIFAGQVIAGAILSFTVTVKEQVAVLPAASVTVEFTVVTPLGKKLPLAGTDTTDETAGNVPDAFSTICMFGKPIAVIVTGLVMPQDVAAI